MTAKQIDNMSIEAIEELANTLTEKELSKWCGSGYSGKCYIEIIKSRKNTAKELYFSNVANDSFRNNFLNQLETHLVIDKRSEGYYCCYCGKIDKKEVAFTKNDYVVFPRKANNEVWIVNEHYDGCRGWD